MKLNHQDPALLTHEEKERIERNQGMITDLSKAIRSIKDKANRLNTQRSKSREKIEHVDEEYESGYAKRKHQKVSEKGKFDTEERKKSERLMETPVASKTMELLNMIEEKAQTSRDHKQHHFQSKEYPSISQIDFLHDPHNNTRNEQHHLRNKKS